MMMSLQYLHTALLLVLFPAFICIVIRHLQLTLHWKSKTTSFQNRLVVRTTKYVVLHTPRIIFKEAQYDLTFVGKRLA